MKNLLLGIIAINITFISAYLALSSVEPVQAEEQLSKRQIENIVEDVLYYELEDMVEEIVEDCRVYGEMDIYGWGEYELWDGRIRC